MRRLALLATAVAVLAAAPAAGAAGPLKPRQIVAKLNAERSRLGLGRVTLNATWSAKCQKHNRWMRLNNTISHFEFPGTRGYTKAGNWAGSNAVLAIYSGGWRAGNPWLNAPLHLTQVYHPRLTTTGASDAFDGSCLTTWPGVPAPPSVPFGTPQADRVWTYPKDGGRAPYGQRAAELPFIPQQKVGISPRRRTGPHLYVWSETDMVQGWEYVDDPAITPPLARLVSGSLIGPGGRNVPVKVIGDADLDGLVGPGNGYLLPPRPLKRDTRYKATVVLAPYATGTQRSVVHTWTFRTSRRTLGY